MERHEAGGSAERYGEDPRSAQKVDIKFFDAAIECAVSSGSQGRVIFNHVKIALGKSSRTLPRTFKALLTTSPHHILE